MTLYEIPGVGRIYSEKLSDRSTKVCAEIAEFARICLAVELEPMKSGIEKEIEEMFKKYESILIDGFVKGLAYVAMMIDIERRSEESPIYM